MSMSPRLRSLASLVPTLPLFVGCAPEGGAADPSAGSDSTGAVEPETGGTGSTGAATGADATGEPTGDEGSTGPAAECMPLEPLPEGAVLTTHGAVQGTTADGITTFLGIPYAAAPTGARRFAPPEDPACWSDVLVADAPAPACTQLEAEAGPVVGDEDCLFLNVYTPQASPERLRPVMVFLHGGGHATGNSASPLYDGTRLARERDVVIVTVNYRLGALGYLAHESLDATDPRGTSGNYGLLDQLHALRWVADNAMAFGGDPSLVTLFGESAGAVSTCAVLGAPEAEGLVHRAIVQSGTCQQRSSAIYRATVTTPWIDASPCAADPDVAACLRALPAEDVIAAEPTGFPSVSALGQVWSPYVDGVTLPASTLDAWSVGEGLDVPLVVGANAEETAREVPPLDDAAYQALVGATFGPLAPMVLAQYPATDYDSPTAAYVALTSDAKFICGARRAARAAAGGAAAFRYHLTYDGYTALGPMADASAFHGLELVYVFGNFDTLLPAPLRYEPNADDLVLADGLGDAWATFARTGDPSTAALPWPAYAVDLDPYMGLDVPSLAGEGVRTAQCDFWDGLGGD